MEIDGGVKGDVSVEESLSAQCDEVSTHGEEHVGKQEGDGGRRATRDSDANDWSLREACSFGLQSVVWKQCFRKLVEKTHTDQSHTRLEGKERLRNINMS